MLGWFSGCGSLPSSRTTELPDDIADDPTFTNCQPKSNHRSGLILCRTMDATTRATQQVGSGLVGLPSSRPSAPTWFSDWRRELVVDNGVHGAIVRRIWGSLW